MTSRGLAVALTVVAVVSPIAASAQRAKTRSAPSRDARIVWTRLTTSDGGIPLPGRSPQQTAALAVRIDKDSPATDFVIGFRVVAPALVWYRHSRRGWQRYVIESQFLTIEAGGVAFDIDGDGDLDVVFGGDWESDALWWWENPYPHFDPDVNWNRHVIKSGGAHQHHDQVFADFEGTGRAQLVFWNQGAKTLCLAEIPKDPRRAERWPLVDIFSGNAGEGVPGAAAYAEGLDAYDIDGDGRKDLLAGNYWFKYEGSNRFKPIKVGAIGGRIRAARLWHSRYPQIVIAPGDGSGPLEVYECRGNPTDSASWHGRSVLERDMVHGHTLEIADVDGDGHLDILAGEQGTWEANKSSLDNSRAKAWLLFGDGRGHFRPSVISTGEGWHEGKIGDFDGDGDLDLLQKPYAWNAPWIGLWLNGTAHRRRR